MTFLKLSLAILLFVLVARASSGGEEKKEVKAGPPKESYAQLDAKVKDLQGRVDEKRKTIKDLAEKKSVAKNDEEVRKYLDEMIVEARAMKENFVKFQKEKKRLKYEFPGKGDTVERQYKRFELDMTEEFNSWSNIDIRLKGVLEKVEEAYIKPPAVVQLEEEKRAKKNPTTTKSDRKSVKDSSFQPSSDRPTLSY